MNGSDIVASLLTRKRGQMKSAAEMAHKSDWLPVPALLGTISISILLPLRFSKERQLDDARATP